MSRTTTADGLAVRRSGVAWLLHALFAPGTPHTAQLGRDQVVLDSRARTESVLLRDVVSVSDEPGVLWRGVTIEVRGGRRIRVPGLRADDAAVLARAIAAAREDTARAVLASMADALSTAASLIREMRTPTRYLRTSAFRVWLEGANRCLVDLPARPPSDPESKDAVQVLSEIQLVLRDPDAVRAVVNVAFVRAELDRMRTFLDRIESRPLTEAQRRAVVVDEDRNLVVAAAGSGKTSVIVAKAAYLVRAGLQEPSRILMLAFARDAADEMRERLVSRLGPEVGGQITVTTFHALGLSILGAAEGRRPSVAKEAEDQRQMATTVRAAVAAAMRDVSFAATMLTWFRSHFAPYRSELEFTTQGEYWDYVREHEMRGLGGELVKSFEECEIANFLYLNGVSYVYERPYEYATATAERGQYRPDFSLVDAGIYIEHFAVARDGRAPAFVGGSQYVDDMKWKRELHARQGTRLIETYSYEKSEGLLLDNLREKLAAASVQLRERAPDEVFSRLEELGRFDRLTDLATTFIRHFKSSGLSLTAVRARGLELKNRLRAAAFLDVFEAIFPQYEAGLRARGEIDFEDMVLQATGHAESGRYRSPFNYILVDEFQDISQARARLVHALLAQNPAAQLFGVGDDWQSIYRFADADVSVTRDFAAFFGPTARTDLGHTFRCNDRICSVATRFVTCNPEQLRKQVSSERRADRPCVHIGLAAESGAPSLVRKALTEIDGARAASGGRTSVLILGRYRRSQPANLAELQRAFPALEISFLTVHRSKGLEADFVLVMDLQDGRRGFPSAAQDDPLINLVLARAEPFKHAEERRLFYVALTRARHGVYLIAAGERPSRFVRELLEDGYDVDTFGDAPAAPPSCPRCVTSRLALRAGARGRFWGCTNFPYCDFTDDTCPACDLGLLTISAPGGPARCGSCGHEVRACPGCGLGRMVERDGPYGRFLGCSTFPQCRHKSKAL